MSKFCPEWIFGIFAAQTAKEFLSSNNSIAAVSRKYSNAISERYTEVKFEEVMDLAEKILQFLSDLEANEDAVNYIDRYIFRRICFKSTGAERKISGMFSSELDPVKSNEYSVKNVLKIFRATVFALRNHTVTDMQPGWTYEEVEGLDWLKDLFNKPTNILDNF